MTPVRPAVRDTLRSALREAMKARDKDAVAAYRTALAAIDNAEAVPVDESHRAGAIELSPSGVGAAEVPRRLLDESAMCRIVRDEAVELRAAAASPVHAAPDRAARLRRQAELLEASLGDGGGPAGQ